MPSGLNNKGLYSPEQSREPDRIVIEDFGVAGIRLMKRAGRAAFAEITARWPDAPVTVFCGSGNNGGDGYVIAALAAEQGLEVQVVQVAPASKLKGDAAIAFNYAEAAGVVMVPFVECLPLQTGVLVDALLGTGFKGGSSGQAREPFAQAIRCINHSGLPVLAVDIPSGLSGDTGAAGDVVVKADVTVTFIGIKRGLLTGRGPSLCGELLFNDLEVPADVYRRVDPAAEMLDLTDLLAALPARKADAHKGDFGHVMVIGGDHGYGGAVAMAAEAALRVGAGLVSVATRPEHVAPILARRPELMVKGVASGQELEPLLENGPTVLIIGPGLGQSPWSEQMLQKAVASGLPMVVDADALNMLGKGLLASNGGGLETDHWILTPHPGEAARLLGVSNAEVQGDRFAAVQRLQQRFNCPVVLKGAGSLVCTESYSPVGVCMAGNPGMASGGMGDVLSGVVGGLVAQQLSSAEALPLAVCLHAGAADRAAEVNGPRGLLATDLMPHLRALVNSPT
ncbi:MAG: NAD(P)H-hydrate dehydratase [Porticoccaceae bacterium]